MTQTPIAELDFNGIKDQLKAYLRGQTRFKDYNFDGANMSVMLDVLAYNTYQNNFYTNMAVSEMFLDSAILESSVLSHAKELNYLPSSAVSAKAEVALQITNSSTVGSVLLIPTNTKFSAVTGGKGYNFYTASAMSATRVGTSNVFTISCLPIYEGELVDESFHSNDDALNLSNKNIDISSIKVMVNSEPYIQKTSIYGVNPSDKVFYIEPSLNGNYGISFGKNIFGKQPTQTDVIYVSYRISSGEAPNGASRFTTSFENSVLVTTFSPASGGSEKESIESIKYFAPKSIQVQERAITTTDYETLLKKEFGSSIIKSVSVFGGDQLEPPRYGKVAISINPYENTAISSAFKTDLLTFLSDKTPLPITPIFIDPEFLYAKIEVDVYYSKKTSTKTSTELEILVRQVIDSYDTTFLGDFGSTLQLSRLSSLIDASDVGIRSNTIEATPIIDYSPTTFTLLNPQFNFGSSLIQPYPFVDNENISSYIPAIKSSTYVYNGVNVFFQDDGKGKILVLSNDTQTIQVLNPIVGTIDYTTGVLKLVNFKTDSYVGKAIKIYANTTDKNITATKNRVFSLRDEDVVINMVEVK